MTVWRAGHAVAPKKVINLMTKLQGHLSSGVNSIAQKAAVEALLGAQDLVEKMRMNIVIEGII